MSDSNTERTWASPTVLDLRNAVKNCLPEGTRSVVVGCSGGPDSLVLTAVASWVGQREGFTVRSLTVDHQLQVNSDQIAREAATHARLVGANTAEVISVTVDTAAGIEAGARIARREALLNAAQGDPILLGHTSNDQAETVLLRLLRGAGAHSLGAMSQCDGLWHRPFLRSSRTEIHTAVEEILAPLGIIPWTDPHNTNNDFARVRIREVLAELTHDFGPGVQASLVRTADLLRADDAALEELAESFCELHVEGVSESPISESPISESSISELENLPTAIRTRVIRRMYGQAAGVERVSSPLTYNHVQAIDALITDWHGQGEIALPLGVCAQREYGRLRIYRNETMNPHQISLNQAN